MPKFCKKKKVKREIIIASKTKIKIKSRFYCVLVYYDFNFIYLKSEQKLA